MEISINDIQKLPPQTQLELAEQIWDGHLHSGHLLSEQQISETRRRARELNDNPSIAMTEEQMWAKVDELRNARRP
jgi:putative addiction module component (TIGR02574 family)